MGLWDRIKAVFALKSHTHNYAGSSSPGGAATSAAKLSTPRNIVLSDAVDSLAQSFDGSKNVSIPVYSLKESYLAWGGKSKNGAVSPIGCALSAEHSANRLAFIDGDAVAIEYSSDGGATWTDFGYSAYYKSKLFTMAVGIPIGRAANSEEYTVDSATRVTISAEGKVYTKPRKMIMNISSSSTLSLTVETRTGEDGAAWKEYGTYPISGWSGWNDIPLVIGTLGGTSSQTTNIKYLRLTIRATRVGSNKKECQLLAIRLFGDTDWLSASYASGKGPMSSTGHLYDFDMAANATFPAGVKASSFTGQLNGSIATKDGVNASLEKLPTWTATPTDSMQLVRRDTGNTATYGRVTFLTVWNYIKGKADTLYAAKKHTHPASDITGLSANATDYIVECGVKTADGVPWYYRKWESGRMEAWATIKRLNATTTYDSAEWGYYVKADAVSYPAGFFDSTPRVYMTIRGGTFGWGVLSGLGSKDKTPDMYLYRPTESPGYDVYFDLYAFGKWK